MYSMCMACTKGTYLYYLTSMVKPSMSVLRQQIEMAVQYGVILIKTA